MSAPYQKSLEAGFTNDEIIQHLESHPEYGEKIKKSREAGYSNEQIGEFLSKTQQQESTEEHVEQSPKEEQPKEERGFLAKAGRLASQIPIAVAEAANLPYEIGVALPLKSKSYYENASRQRIVEDMEYLLEKNTAGWGGQGSKPISEWNEKDRELYGFLKDRLQNPEKISEDVKDLPMDVSIRGLASKATGVNLHPEDWSEKAANWIGYIKNPTNFKEMYKQIGDPRKLMENIGIGPHELSRGAAAGGLLQMAEDGQFGPAGTMAMGLVGDYLGKSPKFLMNVAKNPQKYAADLTNLLTMSNTKSAAAKELIKQFEDAGLVMDAGTLTDSPFVKMIQARLGQSGLTGEALSNLRQELTQQFVREFEAAVGELGEVVFENNHQAAEAVMEATRVPETNLAVAPRGNTQFNPEVTPQRGRSLQGRIDVEPAVQNELNFLDQIGEESSSTYQAGQNLKTTVEDIKRPIKEDFSRQWDRVDDEIGNIEAGPQPRLATQMDNFVRNHEGSLLLGESAPERRVLEAATTLRDQLTTEGGDQGVRVDDLLKTKRTLGDIAKFEYGGSNYESHYKTLIGYIDDAIMQTLEQQDPGLLDEFERLNAEYSHYKDVFEDKNVMDLFNPKNQNYNSLFNKYTTDPDKLRSLEDMISFEGGVPTEAGNARLGTVKREFAKKKIRSPGFGEEDIGNLRQALGPEHEEPLERFIQQRNREIESPGMTPRRQEPLGLQVERPQTEATSELQPGRVSETSTKSAAQGKQKKYHEFLSKKKPDQILNEFDTIEGIRRMKQNLSLTPEGKELFKQLSRYKVAEIIDKKMIDSATNQVKLGTFSHLASTTKEKAILKELVGEESFNRIESLQKHAGKLNETAAKFFNASNSGTVGADMAAMGYTAIGALTLNPYMFLHGVGMIGGARAFANLLADPKFMKELQKTVMNPDPKKFSVDVKALQGATEEALRKD